MTKYPKGRSLRTEDPKIGVKGQ